MPMITPVGFQASLTDKLLSSDTTLPLSAASEAALTTAIGDDGYVYLIVQDQVGSEVIKVYGSCGARVVVRGVDGTTPLNFPKGSCVSFRMTPASVRDMVCNTVCCEGDCCTPVEVAAGNLRNGVVSDPYADTVIFSGTLPIQIAVSALPRWMTATTGANYVKFTGTPPAPQTVVISVAATNCNNAVVVANSTIIIS